MPEGSSPPAEPRLPFEAGRAPVKFTKVTLSREQWAAAVATLAADPERFLRPAPSGRPVSLATIAFRLHLACGFPISENSVPGICKQAGLKYPTQRRPRPRPAPAPPAPEPAPQPPPPDVSAPFVVWA